MSQQWIGILIAALPSLSAILGIIAALVKIRSSSNMQKEEVKKIAGEMKDELNKKLKNVESVSMLCRSVMQENVELKQEMRKLHDEIRRIKRNDQV